MKLTVGTDSTWSLRAWICSKIAGVEVDLNVIDLTKATYKEQIFKHSSAGLVPCLTLGSTVIHDSLAIVEYFNELEGNCLYPTQRDQRALARSLCAELHSGFTTLRSQCPFTLEPTEPITERSDAMNEELKRVTAIFASANLPFMFDNAGAVDAFYAILAFRLKVYGITLEGKAGQFQTHLLEWHWLKEAIVLAKSWHK